MIERLLKTNVRKINEGNSLNNEGLDQNFTSSLGALKIIKDGWETEAIPEISDKNIKKIGFFSKIFKNILKN